MRLSIRAPVCLIRSMLTSTVYRCGSSASDAVKRSVNYCTDWAHYVGALPFVLLSRTARLAVRSVYDLARLPPRSLTRIPAILRAIMPIHIASVKHNTAVDVDPHTAPVAPTPQPLTPMPRRALIDLCRAQSQLCEHYFHQRLVSGRRNDTDAELNNMFVDSCALIQEALRTLVNRDLEFVVSRLHTFDYDADTPGNGFRSTLAILDTCLLHIVRGLRRIERERAGLFFKQRRHALELDAYARALRTLALGVEMGHEFLAVCPDGELFCEAEPAHMQRIMSVFARIDQECFYGRVMGFQFYPSMVVPFRVVAISMAAFSEGFLDEHIPDTPSVSSAPVPDPQPSLIARLARTFLSTRQYITSAERRAKRIVQVTRNANIEFCRAFWALSEAPYIMKAAQIGAPTPVVNQLIHVPLSGCLALEAESRESRASRPSFIRVAPPNGGPPFKLPVRLLCHRRRRGQALDGENAAARQTGASPSRYLVFHCHGGGFISLSSKAHEVYLLNWTKALDIPLVSIDYSLAPEHPYPRALDECVYAYAWCLNNPERLGWTGEHIILVGDSAGGNLVTSLTLRLLAAGVRHRPAGLVTIYTPFLVRYIPSPSRFLSLLDPLLPIGIVARCMAAYTGNTSQFDVPTSSAASSTTDSAPPRLHAPVRRCTWPKPSLARSSAMPVEECLSVPPSGTHIAPNKSKQYSAYINFDASSPVIFTQGGGRESCDSISDNETEEMAMRTSDYVANTLLSRTSNQCERSHSISMDEAPTPQNDEGEAMAPVTVEGGAAKEPEGLVWLDPSAYERDFVAYLIGGGKDEDDTAGEDDGKPPLRIRHSLSFTLGETVSNVGSYLAHELSGYLQPRPAAAQRLDTITERNGAVDADELAVDAVEEEVSHLNMVLNSPASPLERFQSMRIEPDMFMSPLDAPTEILSRFPPTRVVACHMDPLLDDSIMMAKRLRAAGAPSSLHLLESLPHGFLNFSRATTECRQASASCVQHIRELMELNR